MNKLPFIRSVLLVAILLFFSTGCVFAPNRGEARFDSYLYDDSERDHRYLPMYLEKGLEAGHPWTILRMGLLYEHGIAVERDVVKAVEEFYKPLAIMELQDDEWSNAKFFPVFESDYGEEGYFNRNGYILTARLKLVNWYSEHRAKYLPGQSNDIATAYLLINNILDAITTGPYTYNKGDVVHCCAHLNYYVIPHNYFQQKRIEIYEVAVAKLGLQKVLELDELQATWSVKDLLHD